MKHFLVTITAVFFISLIVSGQIISMTVESTAQGKFKSETNIKSGDRADKIDLVSFVSELSAPRDPATGMATGKRQYQPLVIVKESGASSPQFLQAAATNEVLKKVVIEVYRLDRMGMQVLSSTITLENANVAGVKQYSGTTNSDIVSSAKHSSAMDIGVYDEIRLTFQKITVESKTGGTVFTDDWGKGGKF